MYICVCRSIDRYFNGLKVFNLYTNINEEIVNRWNFYLLLEKKKKKKKKKEEEENVRNE